jgi:hypothetical protein
VRMPCLKLCPRCSGRIILGCIACGGSGMAELSRGDSICRKCKGEGKIECPVCSGLGELIPAGVGVGKTAEQG